MNYCQNKIKNVLIIGLGGVGTVYANLISKNQDVNLRILVDEQRLLKYENSPRLLNNIPCKLQYITPKDSFNPDLIIIATKSNGLNNAIQLIKSYVNKDTIIMSFINGISSEETLSKYFEAEQILHSYIICHTITRIENNIIHDGITKVVWGDKNNNPANIKRVKNFFDDSNIIYELSDNIIKSLWEKFCFNCCVNQISAIKGYTFEQISNDKECLALIEDISKEINMLAISYGLNDINLVQSTFKNLKEMLPQGKTSMLQDVENGRKPEIELFGEEVLKRSQKQKLNLQKNKKLFEKLKSTLKQKQLL